MDIASGVSRVWRQLFPRLLAREPEKRLSDAAGLRDFFDRIARDTAARKRRRVLRRPVFVFAALTVLLAAVPAALHLSRRPPAPEPANGNPAPANEEDTPFGELSAKTWVRRYEEALQAILDRAVEAVPDAATRIRAGKGQVVLSGDLARGEDAPAVLLDGGTLLVSPSRAALREIAEQCAQYLETAPDWAPLPAFLPAISRDTVSAPILVGDGGGELDALDTAIGIDFPASLPKAPRPDGWQDLAQFDLLFAGPIRPADGLDAAPLRIAADAPDIAFSVLDSRIRPVRLPPTPSGSPEI